MGELLILFLVSFIFVNLSLLCSAVGEDRKLHIVYMGSLREGKNLPTPNHLSMLQKVVGDNSLENILVRNYGRSFNGFAANLTNQEIQKLANMNDVVSVFPSETLELHTTRSWDFMGFNETVKRESQAESNIIVGVIDTGIWPESESFSDEGFGPIPEKWKGSCQITENFACNKKIIGARFYSTESARDAEGHGSHTASTVAGNKVKDASFFGLAQGVARGGVPSARIAAYRVCNPFHGCQAANILAAFDDAIADGVDIITISVGSTRRIDFTEDVIAIGAFHAMEKGILTVNSAGNSGPSNGTIKNVSPWSLSVAASTIDRLFIDKIVLGNETTLLGYSINSFSLKGTKYPLVIKDNVSTTSCDKGVSIRHSTEKCPNEQKWEGKIVISNTSGGGIDNRAAGAVGSIFKDQQGGNLSDVVPLPALALSLEEYNGVLSYVNTAREPKAEILRSESIKDYDAPKVAQFSSRGPNTIIPEVMKPDVTAPGVNILAAYSLSQTASPSMDIRDERRVKYNIMYGTSMACPHAAGVAAYVKSFHPDWSPSTIKSAIMTTAFPMKSSTDNQAEFAYGSGHINPVNAIDPGLVYEASKEDYIEMLCNMGYDVDKLRRISRDNSTCPEGSGRGSPKDLNYPSMVAPISVDKDFSVSFHRTVTNVGTANSTYKADISSGSKVNVKVEPEVVSFKSLNEKNSFDVTVTGRGLSYGEIVSSSLVWYDDTHKVRTPIVVYTK